MKNSLFLDLVTECGDKVETAHEFTKNYGGSQICGIIAS